MPLRFPRSSFHGGRIIDAYPLDSLPAEDDMPNDPASVRFRSIAEILLRGIRRCAAEDLDLNADPERTSNTDEPVLGIQAGKIDYVVVYKVDRLSRSLLEFARVMETFDKFSVSFVSVLSISTRRIRWDV